MTVTKTAALFPGQGAYAPGALATVRDLPEVRETLREIDEVALRLSDGAVSDLLCATDAPSIDDLLRLNSGLLQLAIYGTSVAAHRVLLSRGSRPDVLVGHSFGEIAALVCAGSFSVADGAQIVCHRDAALRAAGELDGYQLALNTNTGAVEQILLLIGDPQAVVAVENHAGQTVVAGPRGTLETVHAIAIALRIGAVPLKSPYPFHSPMLSEAAFDFAQRIRHLSSRRPQVEVCSPILGRAYRDGDDLTVALAGQLTRRVRFADTLRSLRAGGVGAFAECGALETLSKITRNVLGDGVQVIVPLRDSARPGILSGPAETDSRAVVRLALAPGLPADEFDRRWQACVERIAHLAISEFADAVPHDVPVDPVPVVPVDSVQVGSMPVGQALVGSVPVDPVPVGPVSTGSVPVDLVPVVEPNGRPATSSAAESPSRKQLFEQLVILYADALEYPPEVFDEDTDLEAELGVDSVKQTELLMRIGETYRLGLLPEDVKIGELNTLGRIADLITAT